MKIRLLKKRFLYFGVFLLIFTFSACQSPLMSKNQSQSQSPKVKPTTAASKNSTKTSIKESDPEYYLKQFAKSLHKFPKDLTAQDYLNVKSFSVMPSANGVITIYDLSFIGKMTNLKTLDIEVPYQHPDFFANLTQLESLTLNNAVSQGDVNELLPNFENLSTLTNLTLHHEKVERLGMLKPLIHLKSLDLSGNNVIDTHSLEQLTQLELLNLSSNPLFFNLKDIGLLKNLKTLDISNDSIVVPVDLTPIAGLTQLESFFAANIYLKDDVTPLVHLTQLKNVWLSNTAISSLSFLKNNLVLERLLIDGTNINDLSVLSQEKVLTYLDIRRTRVTSVAPLKDLPNLKILLLNKNMTKDWTLLKNKKGLKMSDGIILAE